MSAFACIADVRERQELAENRHLANGCFGSTAAVQWFNRRTAGFGQMRPFASGKIGSGLAAMYVPSVSERKRLDSFSKREECPGRADDSGRPIKISELS